MLQIYNTLSRQKEVFQPLQPGKVGMYVCGIKFLYLSQLVRELTLASQH